jgi:hypothetical protein
MLASWCWDGGVGLSREEERGGMRRLGLERGEDRGERLRERKSMIWIMADEP